MRIAKCPTCGYPATSDRDLSGTIRSTALNYKAKPYYWPGKPTCLFCWLVYPLPEDLRFAVRPGENPTSVRTEDVEMLRARRAEDSA